jgi:hypothetical protein
MGEGKATGDGHPRHFHPPGRRREARRGRNRRPDEAVVRTYPRHRPLILPLPSRRREGDGGGKGHRRWTLRGSQPSPRPPPACGRGGLSLPHPPPACGRGAARSAGGRYLPQRNAITQHGFGGGKGHRRWTLRGSQPSPRPPPACGRGSSEGERAGGRYLPQRNAITQHGLVGTYWESPDEDPRHFHPPHQPMLGDSVPLGKITSAR